MNPMEDRSTNLSRLIEMAKEIKMSSAQTIEQRNSFVYGNTRTENAAITREMVDEVGLSLNEKDVTSR